MQVAHQEQLEKEAPLVLQVPVDQLALQDHKVRLATGVTKELREVLVQ